MASHEELTSPQIMDIENRVVDRLRRAFLEADKHRRIAIRLVDVHSELEFPDSVVVATFVLPKFGQQVFGFRYPIWDELDYLLDVGAERFADYAWLDLDEFLMSHYSADYPGDVASSDDIVWFNLPA